MDDIKHSANLRALQRVDASTVDIISSATHVVLYQFNDAHQQWEKAGIDGSLFLTKRQGDEINPTRFRLVVLNRSNPENLIVDVSGSFQMQVRQPYLIFRDSKNPEAAIRGIWFHDDEERSGVASLLQKVIRLQSSSAGSGGSSTGDRSEGGGSEHSKSVSNQSPSHEVFRGRSTQSNVSSRPQQDAVEDVSQFSNGHAQQPPPPPHGIERTSPGATCSTTAPHGNERAHPVTSKAG